MGANALAKDETAKLVLERSRYRLDIYGTARGVGHSSRTLIRRLWFDHRLLVVQEDRLGGDGEIEATIHYDDFRAFDEEVPCRRRPSPIQRLGCYARSKFLSRLGEGREPCKSPSMNCIRIRQSQRKTWDRLCNRDEDSRTETATTWQSVAILDETGVLAQHGQEAGGAHGALLLPTIDRLLTQSQVKLHELSGLVCSAGPGSFTGIRVGLATGLGLRAATGLPLVLVPTLEAMAWNVDSTIPICPLLSSRRGEVYWAIFRRGVDGHVERVLGEQVGTEHAFVQSLHEPTLVFGAGWTTMAPRLATTWQRRVR